MDSEYTVIILVWGILAVTFWIAGRIMQIKLKSRWSFLFDLLIQTMSFGILVFVIIPRAGLRVQDVLIPLFLIVLLAVAVTLMIQRRRHDGRNH
jgi:hypothetical protein